MKIPRQKSKTRKIRFQISSHMFSNTNPYKQQLTTPYPQSSTIINKPKNPSTISNLLKMDKNNQIFEERLKNSFFNIKKDILDLRNEINSLKTAINEIKGILPQENFLSSTGNKGVINNHQQSTIINNPQQPQETRQNIPIQPVQPESEYVEEPSKLGQESEFLQEMVNNLKKELEKTFKGLTDREFSIFLAIYELEQQLGQVTYSDIANHLSLTEMTIRTYVASLINKHLPIEKTRRFNNKLSLSIKKELKELNLASKLIALRNHNYGQKTLFSQY
jgi:hypothetical protein